MNYDDFSSLPPPPEVTSTDTKLYVTDMLFIVRRFVAKSVWIGRSTPRGVLGPIMKLSLLKKPFEYSFNANLIV